MTTEQLHPKGSGYTNDVLDVTRTGERAFTVHPILGDAIEDAVRTYDNQAAAWHHAAWSRFTPETGVMPRVAGGESFVSRSKGYGSDPRFAAEVPGESLTDEDRRRIERMVTMFIRAKIGDLDDMEVFMPNEDQPETLETPQDAQNPAPEAPAGDEGATTQPDPSEALREALSDSDRHAHDNFAHLAEHAPSEQGREFWQGKADAILGKA